MPLPRVAAIVLNYNGKALTLDTVESLLAMSYPALEVLVVDNGSTDGSHEAVGERFPEVTRLRTEKNLWISGGLNLGIRRAMEAGFDYLLLMNNDVEVDPEMATEMVEAAEGDPAAGAVGPKSYYFAERDRIWSAGGRLRFRESVTYERGMGELDRGQLDADVEVDYVNGCAMLCRRAAIAAAGPWDTVYHLGVEDADWCVRAKAAGYRCLYAHRARLWHKVSPTVGGYTPRRTYETGRSSAIFVRRHATRRQKLSFLFFVFASFPAAYLRELRRGNPAAAVAKRRGVLDGLRLELPPPPEPFAGG